jgi:hypothetical protein
MEGSCSTDKRPQWAVVPMEEEEEEEEEIHPNYFFWWRIIMANHRRPYSWKVICTHLKAVACSSLTQYVWLREPQSLAVFHILCQAYLVCKFLHDSICTVSRGLWVGRPPKFIFTLVPLMSPVLLYATQTASSNRDAQTNEQREMGFVSSSLSHGW